MNLYRRKAKMEVYAPYYPQGNLLVPWSNDMPKGIYALMANPLATWSIIQWNRIITGQWEITGMTVWIHVIGVLSPENISWVKHYFPIFPWT